MLIKLLILINLKLLATYGQQSAPLCGYHVQNGVYTCNLLINNPDIRADFQRIEGVHLTGFNDSSVQLLRASQQTTYNIPSVICRQFSNLKELIVILSQVQVISQSSFAGCFELEILKLYYNSIPSLHPFMFINNPHLHTVDLAYNRIGSLPPDVFRGTLLKTLFLDDNQFQSFLGSRLSDVAETLTSLNLRNNFMTNFPPQTFAPLRNLELLDLDSNQIITFPLDAFNELSNLQDLILYNNQIRWLRPEWFRPLESLQRLRLENNGIEELPQGIFASNNQLQKLWMSNNNIKVIDSNAFGNLQNLEGIYFEFNLIDAIDEKFFNRAVNLYNLYLYSNICTTSLFTNVNNTRQQVRNALRRCFDNFIPANNGSILCNYEANDIGYTCWMDIDNPLGIDFESIPGEHVENFNNENVTSVQSFLQRTQNIPSVICRQFMNLQFIYIAMCRVEELTQEAFEHCANLEYLNLDFDDIRAVPGNTFSSSPKLNTLSLYVNKITEVAPNAFAGTTLEFLNLGVNQISSINPSWFEDGRGAAMKYLRIDSNVIRILPGNGFSNLRHLSELVVSNNPLEEISDNAFFGLDYLEILNLSECHITALQPQWFIDMENLQRLYLIGNQLTELPVGIFHNLTHLSVANNRLQAINANSFRNVNNLIVLNAQNNQINEVDPDLYDNAAGLYTLQLLNNECASINIVNLPLNREFYRDRFELCFENFMLENFGFIECEYTHVEVIGYHCIMSIYNVRGNNNYEEIEGEHLENFGNSDVVFVEAYQQQTTIIPSVICRQFENLKLLYFGFNGVDEIFAGNFDNCRNLEYLNIEANNLRIIPELFIQNSGNLHTLTLDKNQLSAIAENAFVGTAISSLRLEDNLLTDFNVNWFNGINETLQILSFRNNSFTFLPENSFENLQNLQELEIGFNDLSDLSDNIFQGLSNLLFLSLSSCNIRDLKPSWFTDLTSLGSLFLNYNHLTSIPDGIFTNQLTLYEINFNGNRLSSLNSEAFGNLSSILYISAINNRINLIDPKLYDDAENLYNLFLFNNLCVDDSFLSIINNRDVVREQLQTCFENFENDGFMECSYVNNAAYTCELSVQNVLGRANPDRIGGEHDDNMGDADVIFVEALLQHTASFPAVICRQFSSLTYVYILESKLEFLTREAFENCVNLEALILEQNEIRIIPENVFSSLPELSLLSFFSNEINQIHPNAFTGTSLTYINLNENQLTSVNPEWFEGTRGDSLMYYMIGANNIRTLQSNAFPSLPKIVEISLSLNLLTEIADDAFAGLTNLQILELNNCGLETLQRQWFNDLPGLLRIFLNQNNFRELPEGIFGNLTHIYVANNQLQRIDASSFTNLGRLVLFNGRNNQINEIDPVFFNDTQSLYNLQLAGNICVSIDVMNMALNREYYRQLFEQCFDNFNGGN